MGASRGILAVFLAVLGAGCGNRGLEWKEFSSPDGGYRLLMPGTPKGETRAQGGVTVNAQTVELKDGAFLVSYTDLPAGTPFNSDAAIQGMATTYQGKVLSQADYAIGGKPGKGFELEINQPKGFAVGRMAVVDNRLYQLLVIGANRRATDSEVQKFFDSFELTRAVAAAAPAGPTLPPSPSPTKPSASPPAKNSPPTKKPRVGRDSPLEPAGAIDFPPITTPAAIEIKPPKLAAEKVISELPGPIADVAVGGGGRYLILHIPKLKQLAIFDVNEAKVVKSLAFDDDRITFAAGMNKLMVALSGSKVLQRWNLATFEKEAEAPAPEEPKQLLMGSASNGPLGLNRMLVDVESLKPVKVKSKKGVTVPCSDGARARVSANGQVFGTWAPNISPQGCLAVVLEGDTLVGYGLSDPSAGHTCPGPDGKVIFTGRGLFTNHGQPIGVVGMPKGEYTLPACHGDLYLRLKSGSPYFLAVHRIGQDDPVIPKLDNVDLIAGINAWDREAFGTDKRIHFIPAAKLLITIPATNDRLVLHRVDVEAALK